MSKLVEEQLESLLDLLIGIPDELTDGVIDQTGRWAEMELTFLRFFQLAAQEAAPEPMEFCLAHGAFETQEETVIVLAGIVDAFFIDDEGGRERTNLDEAIPITAGAGEARSFQAEDGAGMSEAHFGDEELEAIAPYRRNTGMALILVDDGDMLAGPSQVEGALHQVILARGAASVVAHLHEGGLADIDEGVPIEMLRLDFVRRGWG